jgi:hypothetical protein
MKAISLESTLGDEIIVCLNCGHKDIAKEFKKSSEFRDYGRCFKCQSYALTEYEPESKK